MAVKEEQVTRQSFLEKIGVRTALIGTRVRHRGLITRSFEMSHLEGSRSRMTEHQVVLKSSQRTVAPRTFRERTLMRILTLVRLTRSSFLRLTLVERLYVVLQTLFREISLLTPRAFERTHSL